MHVEIVDMNIPVLIKHNCTYVCMHSYLKIQINNNYLPLFDKLYFVSQPPFFNFH